MSDYREEDIKSSSKIVPSTDESQNKLYEQMLNLTAEMKRMQEQVKADMDKLHKEMDEFRNDKTPYGAIMKSPVIFVCGLFIGVLVMGALAWYEVGERKELRKELIEYLDKMIPRIEASK